MSGLKQINISYNKIQDRLLLQVTNLDDEDIRLWLTYHFTSKVLEALNRILSRKDRAKMDERTAQQVLQADKALASEQSATRTSFQNPSEKLPLGESGGLITAVNIKPSKNGLDIQFGLEDGQSVSFSLPREVVLTVVDSIEKKAHEAEWLFKSNRQGVSPIPAGSMSSVRH